MDISLDELYKIFPDIKRFKKALINAGFTNTKQIVDEYYEGRLNDYRGLGKTHPQPIDIVSAVTIAADTFY